MNLVITKDKSKYCIFLDLLPSAKVTSKLISKSNKRYLSCQSVKISQKLLKVGFSMGILSVSLIVLIELIN